ncbi:MAG: hypothetical protein ACO22U_11185 [bacterium]
MEIEKTYEWANEWVDEEQGGCDDRVYSDSVKDLELPSKTKDEHGRIRELALIVDVREDDELVEQQWAYVKPGGLPSHFEEGLPVPKKFQKELYEYILSKC